MQVVSGPIGRSRVRPRLRLPGAAAGRDDSVLGVVRRQCGRSGAQGWAGAWFVAIHPFEDGNGRIGRAVADMALARSESSPQRFYSLFRAVQQNRQGYYDRIKSAQKGEIWMSPLGCSSS
ncbi:MAG: Fic family protein [Planctomycetota bacterium]